MSQPQHNKSVESRVEEVFAAPGFREKQKATTIELVKGVEDPETDVVLLSAPTGAGKSLVIDAAARATPGSSFITTPLNALVDQLEEDEFISPHIIALKGRNNYDCIHPEDKGTSVDEAICQRDSDFECDMKGECEYYGRKRAGLDHPEVVTNLPYLMAEGMIPDVVKDTFGDREKLFVDECQGVEDFGLSFIQFTISSRTIPDEIWKNVRIPPEKKMDNMEYLIEWVENDILSEVDSLLQTYETMPMLSKDQSNEYEDLKSFRNRVTNFLEDIEDNEWVAERNVNVRKNQSNEKKVVFNPVFIDRFLEDLLWQRGETIVLSSATIPGGNWLDEIGLGGKNAKTISVGSTFPIENRPVICNLDVGKMVSERSDDEDNREVNGWPMAKRIMEIARHHKGQKGMVHCRSYGIMKSLKRHLLNHETAQINGEDVSPRAWAREHVMTQDQYNREESLEEWIDSDTQVFFSVAMDEGVDLDGDKCEWQCLAKTLYPFMTKRMERRKEIAYEKNRKSEFWNYYNRQAVIQMQQAYGRAVRSPTDEAPFYILDSSAKQLIQRNAEMFQTWFLEAITGIKVDASRGI